MQRLKHTHRKGFTLLYAALVSSLLLAFGLTIVNIAVKEIELSSASRESQFAFYAADTGIDCVLYWDIQHNAFQASTSPLEASHDITCAGSTVNVGGHQFGTKDNFVLDLDPLPYCVDVTVWKQEDPRRTFVESRGYNTCDTSDPLRVERAIRATY